MTEVGTRGFLAGLAVHGEGEFIEMVGDVIDAAVWGGHSLREGASGEGGRLGNKGLKCNSLIICVMNAWREVGLGMLIGKLCKAV